MMFISSPHLKKLTALQINDALGYILTKRARDHGNVYNEIRAGNIGAAIGTLCSGAEKRRFYKTRKRVALKLLEIIGEHYDPSTI